MPNTYKPTTPSNKTSNIGIFDSGIGGLSVLQAIAQLLPNENIIYIGDNANMPYGDKPKPIIQQLALNCLNFLLAQNVKMVVPACNTSVSTSLTLLKSKTTLPIPNITRLGAYQAIRAKHKTVTVLATPQTIKSGAYQTLLNQHGAKAVPIACSALASSVEHEQPLDYLELEVHSYLQSMPPVDALILGCTHYSSIASIIAKQLPQNVQIIDPTKGLAQHIKEYLAHHNLLNNEKGGKIRCYFTASTKNAERVLSKYNVQVNHLEKYYGGIHNVPNSS